MSTVFVAALRMVPMALVAPLGPPSVRLLAGASLSLAVGAAWGVSPTGRELHASPALAVIEIAIGLALGLAAAALVLGAEAAGALVDGLRRASVARRSNEGGFQLLWRLLALALFAAVGGPALLVDAVGRSYQALPLLDEARTVLAAGAVVEAGARLLGAAIELAAPLVIAVVLADLVLALVRRAAPSLARGVGAPGGAAVRELFSVAAALGASAVLVAALCSRSLAVGDSMAAAVRALAGSG